MNNIAILASTNGTDMQAIIDAIEAGQLDAQISLVLANKECGALERARNHGLNTVFLSAKTKEGKKKTREDYDKEVSNLIEKHDATLILLIGYMKLLSPWFVEKYKNKVMNIHPSLLPAFAGGMDKSVHEAVLERGCKVTGASLIFIDEGADTGPIIMQKTVEVEQDETPDTLKQKVQEAEQELLLKAIPLYFQGKIKIQGTQVKII